MADVLAVRDEYRTHNWAMIIQECGNSGLSNREFCNEIPKHMDDTSLDFLEDLLPWSENLPEECRKQT